MIGSAMVGFKIFVFPEKSTLQKKRYRVIIPSMISLSRYKDNTEARLILSLTY